MSSGGLWDYDTIPFKLFVRIADGAGIKHLVKRGTATEEQLAEAWEQIVKRNSQATNSYRYGTYFQLMQSYLNLINEYTTCKAMLLHLFVHYEAEYVQALRKKKFFINDETNVKYDESLEASNHKVENFLTKINMKYSEIHELQKENDGEQKSFEELMAGLTMALGFVVADDITLARYNEYYKMLEKKNAAMKTKDGANK